MYLSDSDIAYLEGNPVYIDNIKNKQWSSLSVATLLGLLDAVSIDADNVILVKYLVFLLKTKQEEENVANILDIEQRSDEIRNLALLNTDPHFGEGYGKYGSLENSRRAAPVLDVVDVTSNAGGSLDTDVTLVGALAGYTGYFEVLGVWSSGAETPTWEIQGNASIISLTTPAHVANQYMTSIQGFVVEGDADNQAIFLDTTSANLGNTVPYKWFIKTWRET